MKTQAGRAGGQIANAIIVPMFAVIIVSLFSVFGLLAWSSSLSDKAAEQSERQLLIGATELKLEQMGKQQIGTVIWDKAYYKTAGPFLDEDWVVDNLAKWQLQNHGFTKMALIGRNRETTFSYSSDNKNLWLTDDVESQVHGLIAKVRARFINAFERTDTGLFRFKPDYRINERSIFENGLAVIDDQLYMISASAIAPETQIISVAKRAPIVLVNARPVNKGVLEIFTKISGLTGLKISTEENAYTRSPAHIDLKAPNGKKIAELHWQVNTPGTSMLNRVLPIFAILAIAVLGLTLGIIDFTRHATKRMAKSEANAVHAASHDALSGLPNRENFRNRLTCALVEKRARNISTAVVYIDLDRFKDINDTLGHAAGDEVIRTVSTRVQPIIADKGMMARISGDEFALLLPEAHGREWIEHVLKQVQDCLARPVKIGATELHIGLSMGIAVAPQDGTIAGDLLRKADIALYEAKNEGRGRWAFFHEAMEEDVRTRDQMSRDLRKALENDELQIAYQPQCCAIDREIIAVESLVRWLPINGKPIPPSVFIPVAEETGLINDIGLWVLNRACKDAAKWPDLIVSVNVSPTQFKHPRFAEKLVQTLEKNNFPPSRLEIEVTESVFLGSDKVNLETLQRLKELGVKIALDDFGSGYSSLSYLRRFPFDTLKIDRDFTSSINDGKEARDILAIMIQLGYALGMSIVAEGIEDEGQFQFLQGLGCHRMQGYHLAKPLAADDLSEFLDDYEMQRVMEAPEPDQPPRQFA